MSNLPKVSVAIITYNQENFIRETLDSVIAQDYPNLEIIVADDGSVDRTPVIIREYAESYPGLFKLILADRNAGIAENCNRAFFACKGKYIAWLGGDDLFYPGKIRAQVEAMEADEECDLCYHAVRVFASDNGATIAVTNTNDRRRRGLRELLWDGISLPGSAVMLRRSSCPVNGFNEDIPIANDWLFYTESMLYGYAVRVDGVLGAYRIHGSNVTHKSLITDMRKTFERLRVLRPDLKRAIARAEAIANFREGRKLFGAGNGKIARSLFGTAIREDPILVKAWVWFLLTYMSRKSYTALKQLNEKLRRNHRDLATVGFEGNP